MSPTDRETASAGLPKPDRTAAGTIDPVSARRLADVALALGRPAGPATAWPIPSARPTAVPASGPGSQELALVDASVRPEPIRARTVRGPVRLTPTPSRGEVRWRPQRGQATAEYALVLLGAAAIALLLAAWAAKSGKIGQLFDAVVDQLIGKAG